MHIFKYSKRQGTRAAKMPDQIPEQTKTNRSAKLIAQGEQMSREFREYYVGRCEEVLFEEENEIDGETYFTGYTREYVKVACRTDKDLTNCLVTGKIKGILKDEILFME